LRGRESAPDDLLVQQGEIRLEEQNIALAMGDDVREFVMDEGYDEEFGARPLRRAIQLHVDDALADAILTGALRPGQTARLSMNEGIIKVFALTPEPLAV